VAQGARKIAALYVDPRGPYPSQPGVDWYGAQRDARSYAGPFPIVAHPPCGPWGRLHHFCTNQDATLAPIAVEQVKKHGGVLEHPAHSRLWKHMALPGPGELPLQGVWTLAVEQCRWGHPARKQTWLLMVGIDPGVVGTLPPWRDPVAVVTTSSRSPTRLKKLSPEKCRLTPPPFAAFLLRLARASSRDFA